MDNDARGVDVFERLGEEQWAAGVGALMLLVRLQTWLLLR